MTRDGPDPTAGEGGREAGDDSAGSRRATRPRSRADGGVPTSPGALHGPGPDQRPRPEGRRTAQGIRVDADTEADPPTRRAVVSAVVDHEPGVLSEVSGLFSRRQFNIESLTVGPTADADYARITLVVEEPDPGIEQVKKQLRGLLSVREVTELDDSAIERETALVEVRADDPGAVRTAASTYGAEVVDTSPATMTLSVTGPTERVDDALAEFAAFGIREVARTGATALSRGETPTTEWPRSAGATDDGTTDHEATDRETTGNGPTDQESTDREATDDETTRSTGHTEDPA